jgi:thioredoxin-like negative regulator of GroEL
MEKEFPDIAIYNVDIDNDFEVAKKYSIKTVPSLLFFDNGKERSKIEGLEKTDAIRKAFKALLEKKE